MRIVVDANVVLSAYAFGSVRMQSLLALLAREHQLLIPEQVAQECISVTKRKNPQKLKAMERFLTQSAIETIPMQTIGAAGGPQLRDETDQPILEAAIAANVDIIISGDKDFHAFDIEHPKIMSPTEFVKAYLGN